MKPLFLCSAILMLAMTAPASATTLEPTVDQLLQNLQDEWSDIFYRQPADIQAEKFEKLLPKVHELVERYPDLAEPLVLEAQVLCTYAGAEVGFGSLRKLKRAKELLLKSIAINPTALEAGAYVTLGNLYYRLPGWPISYGNDDLARQYLETALKLFPDELDTNYFYGDFLMGQGEFRQAIAYLEKADKAEVRQQNRLGDLKLKAEVKQRLKAAQQQNDNGGDFFSSLLPSFDEEPAK